MDALGTAFGHPHAGPKPIWGRPGRAKSGQEPFKSLVGHPEDAPRPSRWAVQGPAEHRAASNASADRFLVGFVLSRKNSHVPRVSVFTVFCWVRTKFAPNVHERRRTSKTESFCPPTSKPGASAGPKIEPERPRSSEKTHPKCPRGLLKIFSQRDRANFERDGASSAPDERAEPRSTRTVISESSNGFLNYKNQFSRLKKIEN